MNITFHRAYWFVVAALVLFWASAASAQTVPGTSPYPTALDTQTSLIDARNNAGTTLSSSITDTATSMTVSDTSAFPSVGVISSDAEIMLYSAKTSTTFTGLTRGAEGTTATAHNAGAGVALRNTARMHNVLSDAVRALQAKLGITASTAANNKFLIGTGAGSSAWNDLTSSHVTTALGFTPENAATSHVNSFNARTGSVTLSSLDVTNALGFTPENSATSHVNSFNTRTGSVTLNSTDVQTAIGSQAIHTFYAGPTSGGAAQMSPRLMVASDLPSGIDTALLSSGAVSNAELDFLDGVTSSVQTQLNSLLPKAGGTMTGALTNTTGSSATSGTVNVEVLSGTFNPTATSTMVAQPLLISPTINYSNATPGAGSYEALRIKVTETALPTGTNYLFRASAGSTGLTDRFTVKNDGYTNITAAAATSFGTSFPFTMNLYSSDSAAINKGGGIAFGGYYNGTTSQTGFAIVSGVKENGTAGDLKGSFVAAVNDGSSLVEHLRIGSDGFTTITGVFAGKQSSSGGLVYNEFRNAATAAAGAGVRLALAPDPSIPRDWSPYIGSVLTGGGLGQRDVLIGVYEGTSASVERFRVVAGVGATVTGNLNITGSLTKGSGTFLIDHPVTPQTKKLYHGFVEAPRYDLIYRGRVAMGGGTLVTASIDVASNMSPGTFIALTQNPQCWTGNDDGWTLSRCKVVGGDVVVETERESSDTISWLIIAERNDPFIHTVNNVDPVTGRLIPEHDKTTAPQP
jgi:hypothetical protein